MLRKRYICMDRLRQFCAYLARIHIHINTKLLCINFYSLRLKNMIKTRT